MKKVLHIVESFGGGVFTFLVDLVNALEDNYEIVIAYSKRLQTPEKFEKYFNEKIKFIEVKNFSRNINPIKDLQSFFEVKKIIKQEKPDIIHLHSSKAGFIGRFAANGKKVRMIYNPHGFSFLMQDCSKIKRSLYWIIEKLAAFRKCTIVGCSLGEYKEALKLSKNSICINNGVNIDELKKLISGLNKTDVDLKKLKICTIGRIGFQKNPSLFNEIAEKLPDIQFMWIGDGELRNKLTSKNITVTGWKNREEVIRLLNENNVFILTSLWEGLPISLLEAMYMKKVCIVSNCIGNRDVIRNDDNGYVCEEVKQYVDRIDSIDKNFPIYLTEKAYQDVINVYNIEVMKEKYDKFYNGLL